jgi:hypothetical protein
MAHVGEELRLALARQLVQADLVLDFAEQARVLDCEHRLGCEADGGDLAAKLERQRFHLCLGFGSSRLS